MVRRTWALKGQTPILVSSGSWKSLTMAGLLLFTPEGKRPRVLFRLQAGAMKKEHFVEYLKDIKKEMRGKKLLLIWDSLSGHKAKVVTDYVTAQRSWLRIERYPGYAPELSPVEFLWSPIKTKDLSHVPPRGLPELTRRVRRAFRRIKKNKTLLKNCLRKVGVLTQV